MTIRVTFVIPTLDQGGAEKQLMMLATGLPRDQFDVDVCVLTRTGPLEEVLRKRDVPVHHIHKRWKVDYGAYRRLKRCLKGLQPDVVHTWLFAANTYGRLAASHLGVPHLLAGERCVDRWKVWYEFQIDRYLARRSQRILTNSRGVVDFYSQHGIDSEKFEVIPNGIRAVDVEPFDRDDFLRELDLPADARLIGAVGRLWPQKRYKDLIWAAELLKAVRDDTHFVIIGEGPKRLNLEQFCEAIGIMDRVHFLGHREDVPRILPLLECFWLGSGYEGQSNALMEAMLAGLPVVVSNIPGNCELVVHDQTGLVVPLGDRAGFARATHQLLDDPERAAQLGKAARQRMLDEFSVERMVQRHVKLYADLMNSS